MNIGNNKFTILGGTGTLGKALTKFILENNPGADITILSRDEHKQQLMSREFPMCKFVLGDIRDGHSLVNPIMGRDVVFHVAALKHVDLMELNPQECLKTNLLATENVAKTCQLLGVKRVIFSSTDKAVDPINIYGLCKALSERIFFDYNTKQTTTKFSVYRWGNVIGSNGSAIHYFAKTLKEQKKAFVTNLEMTRFWIPIDWAILFMLRTIPNAKPFGAMVPPIMKSAKVTDIVKAVAEIVGVQEYEILITGIRPGEKIHEALHSMHSPDFISSETSEKYTHSELVDMISPILKKDSNGPN